MLRIEPTPYFLRLISALREEWTGTIDVVFLG